MLVVGEALRIGLTVDEINKITKYDKWFLYQIKRIIDFEEILKDKGLKKEIILYAKKIGYSDSKISSILNIKENELREFRNNSDINPVFRLVDTCAGEFSSKTPYLYSTYDWYFENTKFCEENRREIC